MEIHPILFVFDIVCVRVPMLSAFQTDHLNPICGGGIELLTARVSGLHKKPCRA
jgi:hypothetical protein